MLASGRKRRPRVPRPSRIESSFVAEFVRIPTAGYPGDLLANVISALDWLQANPDWLARVVRVTERASAELEENRDLSQRLAEFLARVRG